MKTTALLIVSLMLQSLLFAQDVTVTGTVRAAGENTLLSGISISASGPSNRGTTTNNDGRYSILVSKDAILTFSSIGYVSQQVPVNGRTEIHILLQRGTVNDLSEVVVTTALGIKKQ